MNTENYIALSELSSHYQMEISFFTRLDEIGLIEVTTIESTYWIHQEHIHSVEKIIRLHQDLEINPEGIATIFNLLDRIETLEKALAQAKNRLRLYEEEE